MSRVDHWIIPRKRNRNIIKSVKLGDIRHKVHKISDRYPTKGISQFHKLEWNNKRKMAGKPMLRRVHLVRVHMQYGKQIIRIMEVKNHEN